MSDDVLYTPYTDAELETLRRCQKGEPVTAADMLLMLSVDMQLMEEWVNNIFALAPPHGMGQDFWDNLNELYWHVPIHNRYLQRWRADFLRSA